MKKILLLLIILLSSPALADITNPQIVSKMKVEITETGSIELSGNVNTIDLNLSIPQEDSYQKIESFEVLDNYGVCSDSCSYKFVYDKFGNKLLSINWKNPSNNINFKAEATVTVNKRDSTEKKIIQEFLKPTILVQSTDNEIADIASKARGTDFEKVAYLSKWINENIKYSTVYSDVNIPAKEILKVKVGVCKEFSNLLVSFLRSLGYYSAVTVGYVHPGNIYTGEKFQPHGWTEVYTDEGILSDPTWAEVGYLDATHIKFATFPDSSWTFSSIYSFGYGNFKVDLKNTNTSVKLLSFEEKPTLSFNSKFLEDDVWKGYAVLKTDITSDRCLLTKLDASSCNSNGEKFLEKISKENITYFCNNKSVFTIFKIPALQSNMHYTCPFGVLVYGNEQKNVPLTLSQKEEGATKLTVDKTTVSPKEKITAFASNSYIFTDNGDYGFEKLEIFVPYGDFNIYSYNKGALDQKSISVVSNKPLEASITANDTFNAGKEYPIFVTVKNLLSTPQQVTVKFRDQNKTEYVNSTTEFSFSFIPQNENDSLLQTVISTSDFSTSLSKPVTVIEEKNAVENVASGFIQTIINFFNWLFSLFKGLKAY
jgi:transglutaminase-like putative cysteine protease